MPQNRLLQEVPRLQTVSMPNVLVRDVPEEVHAGLRRRAESRGQSLQQYLQEELRRLAETPTPREFFERIERRLKADRGSQRSSDFDFVKALHEAREEREQHLYEVTTRHRDEK
jgi:plasmid stability protein